MEETINLIEQIWKLMCVQSLWLYALLFLSALLLATAFRVFSFLTTILSGLGYLGCIACCKYLLVQTPLIAQYTDSQQCIGLVVASLLMYGIIKLLSPFF